jgi:nitrite reductase/ring-hydroxylating ferredoxin subunit
MKFLCAGADLPRPAAGFRHRRQQTVCRAPGGQAYVYLNRCPHRGVGLEWHPDQFLDPSNSLIQCATHGALF